MAYFAEINKERIVKRVIIADQEFINSGKVGNPQNWIETFMDGRRKNYAGIGYKYDNIRDVFIPPKIYSSWILDEEKAVWKAPISLLNDGKIHNWDEINKRWI